MILALALRGHLRLVEQKRSAQRRIAIAVGVSAATLILGVLVVAALKPPDSPAEPPMAASAVAPDKPAPKDPEPSEAAPAVKNVPDEVPEEVPDEAPVAEKAPDEAPEEVAEKPDEVPEEPEEPEEPKEPADEPEEVAEAPALDVPGDDEQWWTELHGKPCKIHFGDNKRLIMREGKINKDHNTTYGPFVNAPIVARVRESLDPVITVHHFGLHPRNGRPALVYGTVEQQGKKVTGILPLQVSGDQLKLMPAGGKRR